MMETAAHIIAGGLAFGAGFALRLLIDRLRRPEGTKAADRKRYIDANGRTFTVRRVEPGAIWDAHRTR